jgi:hypothetical protein
MHVCVCLCVCASILVLSSLANVLKNHWQARRASNSLPTSRHKARLASTFHESTVAIRMAASFHHSSQACVFLSGVFTMLHDFGPWLLSPSYLISWILPSGHPPTVPVTPCIWVWDVTVTHVDNASYLSKFGSGSHEEENVLCQPSNSLSQSPPLQSTPASVNDQSLRS